MSIDHMRTYIVDPEARATRAAAKVATETRKAARVAKAAAQVAPVPAAAAVSTVVNHARVAAILEAQVAKAADGVRRLPAHFRETAVRNLPGRVRAGAYVALVASGHVAPMVDAA